MVHLDLSDPRIYQPCSSVIIDHTCCPCILVSFKLCHIQRIFSSRHRIPAFSKSSLVHVILGCSTTTPKHEVREISATCWQALCVVSNWRRLGTTADLLSMMHAVEYDPRLSSVKQHIRYLGNNKLASRRHSRISGGQRTSAGRDLQRCAFGKTATEPRLKTQLASCPSSRHTATSFFFARPKRCKEALAVPL